MPLPLPAAAPSFGGPLSRTFGRLMLRSVNMKLGGSVPDVPKVILIAGPHTSNLDLILAMGMRYGLGLRYSWMMKKEAFRFPFGGMFRAMGGIAVDRKAAKDVTGQVQDWFAANDKAWIGITPEGTRSKVGHYKKGYLRIAYAANVPIFIVGVDSKTRTLVFDRFADLTGDIDADNERIRNYITSTYTGLKTEPDAK